MRIVALIHFAVPYKMAGSETMIHTMLKALADKGHQVHAVTSDMPEARAEWKLDGVHYYSRRGKPQAASKAGALRPDVVVTHHDNSTRAILLAKQHGIPSVFVQHNTFDLNLQVLACKPDLTVFNTHWIARTWGHKAVNWMVVHPPVWAREHATTRGDYVTLVNLSEHKGVEVFRRLARHFPDTPFLGIIGGHGDQIDWGMPDNVEIIPQTSDMKRDVWSRTRVLLVPSVYESYGMVAPEACASGIPVIANPTPGLQEALGTAGIFANRDKIAEWVAHLRRLLTNEQAYNEASAACLRRSAELSPEPELAQWVGAIEALREAANARRNAAQVPA